MAAAAEFPAAAGLLDFAPQLPCAYDQAFTVRTVFIDVVPGRPALPRINFTVSRQDVDAYTLSETRAEVPFTAIPLSTHRIEVTADAVAAAGFAGPSGTGVDTAYLRWRSSGVTFELSAVLSAFVSEADVRSLAAGLIEHHGQAAVVK